MKRALLMASLSPVMFYALPAAAKVNVQVGTCVSKDPSYATITEALNAVPPGATINVCPNVYAEQLTITKPVTLQGVSDANSSAPTITPPQGGALAVNYTSSSGTQYAAQIVALAAGTVTIANLTVNGAGNTLGCSPILLGVMFVNTNGTIKNNQVINQQLSPQSQLGGCQTGSAIEARNDNDLMNTYKVSITGNQVTGFQKDGINARGTGLAYSIIGNTVVGQGATSTIAQNGIELISGSNGAATGNVVSDLYYTGPTYGSFGVLVYNAPSAVVSGNTVSNTQGAVFDEQDSANATDVPTISKNIITTTHTYDAIDVCGVSGGTIGANTINGSDGAAVHVDGECGSPSVGLNLAGNKVNGACAGVLEGPQTGASVAKNNTFLNTIFTVETGTDSCTPTNPASMGRMRGQAQPAHRPIAQP